MAIKEIGKVYEPFTGRSGIYVSRIPDTSSVGKIVDIVHRFALCQLSPMDIDELHCTIVYSPEKIPEGDVLQVIPIPVAARLTRFEWWPGHNEKGYLVGVLDSPVLMQINKIWSLRGAKGTFEKYSPHVTVQTPFSKPDRIGKQRINMANEYLLDSPMLIRLVDERIEDIS